MVSTELKSLTSSRWNIRTNLQRYLVQHTLIPEFRNAPTQGWADIHVHASTYSSSGICVEICRLAASATMPGSSKAQRRIFRNVWARGSFKLSHLHVLRLSNSIPSKNKAYMTLSVGIVGAGQADTSDFRAVLPADNWGSVWRSYCFLRRRLVSQNTEDTETDIQRIQSH